MFGQDSHEDSESSENSEPTRPNRYDGPVSTWQFLTEPERGLAASLDQLRNEDLSVHLYNAHALKTRAREYEDSKKRKHTDLSAISEDDDIDAQQSFVPPKAWTAWPLPPNLVPREGEHVGPEEKDAKFTLRRPETQRPSGSLEEELVAVSLKIAKEKFEARKWKEDDENLDYEESFRAKLDSRVLNNRLPNFASDQEQPFARLASKQSSEALTEKTLMRPIISADDDRSRELLRPSIRHTLLKLDQVLMALHHARKTCHEIHARPTSAKGEQIRNGSIPASSKGGQSDTDYSDFEETESTEKRRPRGRPRKFENLPEVPQSGKLDLDTSVVLRPKASTIGRPRKQYKRFEGETEQEYIIRVARMQKKPLPPFTPRKKEKEARKAQDRAKRTPRKNSAPEDAKVRWEKNLKPRDWSEVLGSAALVGFPPDAIARATQRCANLFGESMIMRQIVEAPAAAINQDKLKHYIPGELPEGEAAKLATIDISSGSESDSQGSDVDSKESWSVFRKAKGPTAKKISCFCPIAECIRSIHGFSSQYTLTRHLRKGHGKGVDEIDMLIYRCSDEMDGGVHVDGFMKPIQFKGGARGKDKNARKKGRWPKRDGGAVESGSQTGSSVDSSDSGSDQSVQSRDDDNNDDEVDL